MIFETPLNYKEVKKRIEKYSNFFGKSIYLIDRKCHVSGWIKNQNFMLGLAKSVYPGSVFSGLFFFRRERYFFPISFYGRIEEKKGGCRIAGKYRTSLLFKTVSALALLLALILSVYCFLGSSEKLITQLSYLIPILIFGIFFHKIGDGSKDYLANFLISELNAKLEEK